MQPHEAVCISWAQRVAVCELTVHWEGGVKCVYPNHLLDSLMRVVLHFLNRSQISP